MRNVVAWKGYQCQFCPKKVKAGQRYVAAFLTGADKEWVTFNICPDCKDKFCAFVRSLLDTQSRVETVDDRTFLRSMGIR